MVWNFRRHSRRLMCAELIRVLVSLVLAALMVFGFTRLIAVELDQAHALLYAALVLGLYALLGALRYSWRLNRFLELNELSEAEYQWLRHGQRRKKEVTSKRMRR